MYISILDYSSGTVTIINDEDNATKNLQNDDIEAILYALGFKDSQISYMVTEDDPMEDAYGYVTLNELAEDADEDIIEWINRQINVSAECDETDEDNISNNNNNMDNKKDWVGGNASVFKTLGASNHTDTDRQREDYYATEPAATEWLCKIEKFDGPILEPSCGEGHISKVLLKNGYEVESRDLVDRGYGDGGIDFLAIDNLSWNGDIVTNPPYKYAKEFVEKSLAIIPEGHKVAMFLKLTFLEGKGRRHLFNTTPPSRVWVSSSRLKCAPNGDFNALQGSAAAYAWFVWEKGYKGDTIVKWFN